MAMVIFGQVKVEKFSRSLIIESNEFGLLIDWTVDYSFDWLIDWLIDWSSISNHLLGQGLVEQICVSFACPAHGQPLLAGAGLSQARVRNCCPLPHDSLQPAQLDHGDQAPWTVHKQMEISFTKFAHHTFNL